jgi:uncharacterized iron-regulated membrane protein
MELWLIAALAALAVIVVVGLTVYWLRRRRAGTVLLVHPDGRISHRRR